MLNMWEGYGCEIPKFMNPFTDVSLQETRSHKLGLLEFIKFKRKLFSSCHIYSEFTYKSDSHNINSNPPMFLRLPKKQGS